ncbi:hypothetical protein ABPG72_017307 [Tetrahymena utriculariae]
MNEKKLHVNYLTNELRRKTLCATILIISGEYQILSPLYQIWKKQYHYSFNYQIQFNQIFSNRGDFLQEKQIETNKDEVGFNLILFRDELDKLSEQVFLLQILKRIPLKGCDSIPREFYNCPGSSFSKISCKLLRNIKDSYF